MQPLAIDTHHKRFLVLAACVRHIPQAVLNIRSDCISIYRFQIHMQILDSYTELIYR
jgi:hypothetical protein